MKKISVAIIVLTYNNLKDTLECLQSVLQLRYPSFEIVLVDNHSTDGSLEKIKSQYPNIHYVENTANLGVAGGRNSGWRYTDQNFISDYFFFLDNDVILQPDSLLHLVQTLKSHSEVGIVCGKTYTAPPSETIMSAGLKVNLYTGFIADIGGGKKDAGQFEKASYVSACGGFAFLTRATLFRQLNGLAEEFNPYGWEDVDFSFRALQKGYRCYYEPSAVLYHKGCKIGRGYIPLYEKYKVKHSFLFLSRHANLLQKLTCFIILPFRAAFSALKLILRGKASILFSHLNGAATAYRGDVQYMSLIILPAIAGIAAYFICLFIFKTSVETANWPLWITLCFGGIPLIWNILQKIFKLQFSADILAGISIIVSVLLQEYLAGTLVVLMLASGQSLESFAVRRASSVLAALAKRMPHVAHRKQNGNIATTTIEDIQIGDKLIIFPHEICPVDGEVIEGHGTMDESYLTGEPFVVSKASGSKVLSGAINKDSSLTIVATKRPVDSRYAKIMEVMQAAEEKRPNLQRLGNQLGALYTPFVLIVAVGAWFFSQDPLRFLAVLVIATPCPLLIAIPVAVIGSISLSARRGIIIKNPAILEQIDRCRTAILDKTGTLTYGKPVVTEINCFQGFDQANVLRLASSLEQYSKHPLAKAIIEAAQKMGVLPATATQIREIAGEGLRGIVENFSVLITSRNKLIKQGKEAWFKNIPNFAGGLECAVVINEQLAAIFHFHDEPRKEGKSFIKHLLPQHKISRVMIVSGDRETEVKYLAEKVGIDAVYSGKSPEEKIAIVREETLRGPTIYLGDGINDAPALTAATVGIAFGQHSDITAEAAGAVIMENSLKKVDELMHIGRHMRGVALQSAIGGMLLSSAGIMLAALGYLPPVTGAMIQEIIDVFAVLNALRSALPPKNLTDFI